MSLQGLCHAQFRSGPSAGLIIPCCLSPTLHFFVHGEEHTLCLSLCSNKLCSYTIHICPCYLGESLLWLLQTCEAEEGSVC